MNDDPLKDLLIDSDEVDRKRLVTVLKPYAGVDSKTGRIVLKPDFDSLTSKEKLIAYFLEKKVAKLLGIIDSEAIVPKTIPKETGLPGGTVRPQLKSLLENRIISKSEEGRYFIKSYQLNTAIELLKKKEISNG